jgi:hypothetical protein
MSFAELIKPLHVDDYSTLLKNITDLDQQARASSIHEECVELFNKVNVFGKKSLERTKASVEKDIFTIALLVISHGKIKSLKEVTPELWKEILDQIKTPTFKYHDGIKERYQTAFRKIGMLITDVSKDDFFTQYAQVKRSTNFSILENELTPNQQQWFKLANMWIDDEHVKSSKNHLNAVKHFLIYLDMLPLDIQEPFKYLSEKRHVSLHTSFKEKYSNSYNKHLSYLFKFSMWIIENYMQDSEDDEVLSIGYPLISNYQYEKLTGIFAQGLTESDKIVIPTSFLLTMNEILTEDDFKWSKSVESQYFDWYNEDTKVIEKIWCPAQTYTFLTMIEIPIRKIQVQMLDSGEGDIEKYNPIMKAWIKNNSPHANFWSNRAEQKPNRGVLTKNITGLKESVGFYISTNKTKDADVGYGPESGYTIPWNNEILVNHFHNLREWQEKYSPVVGPAPYKDMPKGISSDSKPSQSVLDQTPDRFYLFRSPLNSMAGYPATNNQLMRFWWLLMEELEKRIREEGHDVTIIIKRNKKTGQPERSIFTPHGLRVAGLTSLAEAGVPIEVISKIIAGHSTILMTIYYIKYSNGHVTEILSKAKRELENKSKENLKRWLKDATLEDAMRYLVANQEEGVQNLMLSRSHMATWGGSGMGICPYSGTRCDDGGEIIKRATKSTKAKYGPVIGGRGNCVRCRHLVTGVPWMIELWLHGNKLLESISKISTEIKIFKKKQAMFKKEQYNYKKRKEIHLCPPEITDEIKSLNTIIETKSEEMDKIIMDAHATYNLLEEVREIANIDDKESFTKGNELIPVDVDYGEEIKFIETSDFHLKDMLVQASRIYPEVADTRVELERNNFIDQILVNNGASPISFSPLSEEEKAVASDAMAKFLISKVGAKEFENLHNGSITLAELGIEKHATDIDSLLGSNSVPSLNTAKKS